jgi:putative membrane protein
MNTWRNFSLAAVAAIAAGTLTAQTPEANKPSTGTDPSAASSPHQRGATHDEKTTESSTRAGTTPSAASSPHQHEATKMKAGGAETPTPDAFVKKAAMAGMTEVELAKLALDKSQDANVRGFAQRMVSDHGKANMELTAIAKRKSLEVPKSLDSEHQKKVQELAGKSGTEFDASYAQHMAMDHDKAAALFEGASKGNDAELASFAQKTLPTIKEHQKLAKDLKSQARSATAPASTTPR